MSDAGDDTDRYRGRSRRALLRRGGAGLIGLGGLLLAREALPTPVDGTVEEYRREFRGRPGPSSKSGRGGQDGSPPSDPEVTPPDVLGPFWRAGSPFRGKTTRPLAAGRPLWVQGRVWSLEKRRPLAGVTLDVWHARDNGRYRDDEGEVLHRIRLVTDETGRYEYEAILPGHYDTRPRHIHYRVAHAGFPELITQLYFRGDPRNAEEGVDDRLISDLEEARGARGPYSWCRFDIVLSAAGNT